MRRSLLNVSVLFAALVLLPLAPALAGDGLLPGARKAPGPAAVTTGSCAKAATVDFAVADDTNLTTNSSTFVPVPGMSVTFNQKKGSTCAKVEYSAYVFATGSVVPGLPAAILVRAFNVTDGAECLPAGGVQLSGDDDENGNSAWARSHGFNFVCTGLTPGTKTIQIEWMSPFGDTVYTHKRSMFVHHK